MGWSTPPVLAKRASRVTAAAKLLGDRASDSAELPHWLGGRRAKAGIKYHRTVATTLNTLIRAGFQILAVQEFAPSPEQIAQAPELVEESERPMMLLASAQRVRGLP
jgi:hypothetical protein